MLDNSEPANKDLLPVWIGGGFGRFQLLCYLATGLMTAVHCCQMMCMKFIAYPVQHWYTYVLYIKYMYTVLYIININNIDNKICNKKHFIT